MSPRSLRQTDREGPRGPGPSAVTMPRPPDNICMPTPAEGRETEYQRTRGSRQPAEDRTQGTGVTWQKQKTIITAEPGEDVILPGRAPNSKSILIVEWTRGDLAGENVLLFRDEQLDPEEQHPSFKNRVDLQDRLMKDGDVSLILKNVTINDTGTYECRVFIRGINRRRRANLDGDPISIIYLRVVAPPGPGAPVGLIVGLIVPALLLLLAAAVGFCIYRKSKELKQDSYQPPAELQPV